MMDMGKGTGVNGAFCVTVSRTGDTYTMNGTYYITDIYDFNLKDEFGILPGILNSDMAKLHIAGLSKAFYVYSEKEIRDYVFSSD